MSHSSQNSDSPLQSHDPAVAAGSAPVSAHSAQQQVSAISSLLKSLDEASADTHWTPPASRQSHDNRLVQVRLGIASSLFTALRAKHPPTAAHSLRVALGCTSYAFELGLPEATCDIIEMAALLHDIGKIGVPDSILRKPGRLSTDEAAIVRQHRAIGLEILAGCCASRDLTEVVQYAPAWYNGSLPQFDRSGDDIPLGARVLAIVDAYDAMTTDHVYRPARSRERALAELFQFSGSQFDPELVKKFGILHQVDATAHDSRVVSRWLDQLAADHANSQWRLGTQNRPAGEPPTPDALFEKTLVRTNFDSVVFIDSQLRIILWNQSAERLTGLPGSAVCQRRWSPSLLEWRDQDGGVVPESACPVAHAIKTGVPSQQRLLISGRHTKDVPVYIHVMPVTDAEGTTHGATLVLHDMSPEATLERRCASLRNLATKDPLTGVANRAELDRMQELFIDAHAQNRLPCALIICDIDHFKLINDNHGHQAGDEVIKCVAGVLAKGCRPGDVVARYGGEEFVVLCADSTNAAATGRAEQMRHELANLDQPALGTGRVTASFGVTELQAGDTPETMFRRADRALLQAKETGRNRVIQLGAGMKAVDRRRRWWQFRRGRPSRLLAANLVTRVPTEIAVEKLRGFVADHGAKVTSIQDDQICLTIEGNHSSWMPRHGQRSVPLLVEVQFADVPQHGNQRRDRTAGGIAETRVHVVIRPKRDRDRRRQQATERAAQVMASLKSYLMAEEETVGPGRGKLLDKARQALGPRGKKPTS